MDGSHETVKEKRAGALAGWEQLRISLSAHRRHHRGTRLRRLPLPISTALRGLWSVPHLLPIVMLSQAAGAYVAGWDTVKAAPAMRTAGMGFPSAERLASAGAGRGGQRGEGLG
jgi:hypothetical protein